MRRAACRHGQEAISSPWGTVVLGPALFLPALLTLLFCFLHGGAFALDVPPLRGYVNDTAAMMSPQARSKLEGELKAFEQSDSTQIVILTIPSLEGEALEDFSIKVAEMWEIGHKGKDNGVILLVAAKERKIRIEVGRGLEGRLTDLTAGRVVDLVIAPRFKRGDFDGGFVSGIAVLIDAVRGEFKADMKAPARGRRGSTLSIPALLIFGGGAILVLGRLSRVLGGVAGVAGLPLIAFLLIPAIGFITLALLSLAGLLMGVFLPGIIHGGPRGRDGGGWYYGGFGGFGGGGSGGGDFGGGFSGGGGDFGGGGASGDW